MGEALAPREEGTGDRIRQLLIRIANSCEVTGGQPTKVHLPEKITGPGCRRWNASSGHFCLAAWRGRRSWTGCAHIQRIRTALTGEIVIQWGGFTARIRWGGMYGAVGAYAAVHA